MTDDQCVVCSRYITADRSRIRYLVIEESIRTGTRALHLRKSLCEKHHDIGYSARSHTVGEAGQTLDTTEAGVVHHKPPLPTLSDFGVRHRSHHEYNVRRLRRQKLRRRGRKINRP
ncbi:MAG: hypothetical protein [Circular genetic element sp.]|nr:MAG: hypothetical protein [Circular genetic element sp.]